MLERLVSHIRRREGWWLALLLFLLLVLFFCPATLGGRVLLPVDLIFEYDPLWQPLAPAEFTEPHNYMLTDQVYQFYAWKLLTRRALSEGVMPLWNPYMNSGQPFLANAQSAVLSPFSLISYLFAVNDSFVVVAVLRLFMAGFFTYHWARTLQLGRWGALLAALTFTFSQTMVVWVGHPLANALSLLPLMLFVTERALSRRVRYSGLYVLATGLVIGAQFLGGHPETSFHMMVAWAVYALYRTLRLYGWRDWGWVRPVLKMAGALAIGLGVAAVQLLPFVDFILRSDIYASRAAWPEGGGGSLAGIFNWHNWPTAITLLLPNFFGTPLDNSYWYPHTNYSEQAMYVGIVPLALATLTSFYALKDWLASLRPQPASDVSSPTLERDSTPLCDFCMRSFFVLAALVTLGVALRLPGFHIVHELPVFDLVVNERFRMIFVLFAAILAGMGLDRLAGRGERGLSEMRGRVRTLVMVLVLFSLLSLLAIGAAAVGFRLLEERLLDQGRAFMATLQGHPLYPEPLETYYSLVETRHQRKLALYAPQNVVMFVPLLVGLSSLLLYRWTSRTRRNKWRPGVWTGFVLLWTVVDLFAVGMPFNPTIELQHIFPPVPAIQFLHRDPGVYRVVALGPVLRPNSNVVVEVSDVRGFDAIIPGRYVDVMHRLEGAFYLPPHFLFTRAESPWLDELNVKYLLLDAGGQATQLPDPDRWEPVYEDGTGIRVYRNRTVLPRAFVVHRAEVVARPEEALERALAPDFDWQAAVVLEQTPPPWLRLPATLPQTPAAVRIVDYQLNRVSVEVDSPAPGFLILTDTYAPGWRVRWDRRPDGATADLPPAPPVYVANHAFRAVPIPAGEQRLTFTYEPVAYSVGWRVSLATVMSVLLLGVGGLVVARRRRRARPEQDAIEGRAP